MPRVNRNQDETDTTQVVLDERSDLLSNDNLQTVRLEAQKIARDELAKESKEIRKEFIAIFGLFAAFLTFTVLQIQGFIQAQTMALIMGAASFFVASSITFVITLHNMLHGREEWKDFRKPIFVIVGIIFLFSFSCFYYHISSNERGLAAQEAQQRDIENTLEQK